MDMPFRRIFSAASSRSLSTISVPYKWGHHMTACCPIGLCSARILGVAMPAINMACSYKPLHRLETKIDRLITC